MTPCLPWSTNQRHVAFEERYLYGHSANGRYPTIFCPRHDGHKRVPIGRCSVQIFSPRFLYSRSHAPRSKKQGSRITREASYSVRRLMPQAY